MTAYDSLPDSVTEVFGEDATAEQAYDLLTVDVPPGAWITALETARDTLGCTYFDWLSAVDEPGTGFRVCAHVAAVGEGRPRRLLIRTTVPHDAPVLPTAIGVYAGAGWHERETHEMFGVDFTGHPHLVPLLLPENFEGHPLRKDFVLAARVAKAWPGAKEPGEAHEGGPKRRQMLPPGVPDPNEWGPLKGQLPPAPARPARAAAGDRPARRTRSVTEGSATPPETPTDTTRPPRRTRSVADGSASQAASTPEPTDTPAAGAPPRRTRSVADGSASQAAPESAGATETPPAVARPPRRTRSASEGSASQAAPTPEPSADTPPAAARPPRRTRSAADGSASQSTPDGPAPRAEAAPPRTRSSDAPWHHARPAFDKEPTPPPPPAEPEAPAATPEPEAEQTPDPQSAPAPEAEPAPAPEAAPASGPERAPEAAPVSKPETPAEPETVPEPTPDPEPTPEPTPEPETRPEPTPAPGATSGIESGAAPQDGPTGPAGPAGPTSPTGPSGPIDPTTPTGGDPA
ncbi:NADH-quinone oxidoreductase subunit C [Streptomyces flavochromogenes]|uniref:NADH-quinone oxidoreductase subunit C n=1 Tax=Streptomyces flavochromogenes TaxID=68199 RepID=UPI0004C116A3|nr:NADH-quinone oxidoreductase subunit C [Streptomyces flavochromogenes]